MKTKCLEKVMKTHKSHNWKYFFWIHLTFQWSMSVVGLSKIGQQQGLVEIALYEACESFLALILRLILYMQNDQA